MNEIGDAYERAVQSARRRDTVVNAIKCWEAWIIAGSILYFVARIWPGITS